MSCALFQARRSVDDARLRRVIEADSGSSSRSTCGSVTSDRASATRWRSPPEIAPGLRVEQMSDAEPLGDRRGCARGARPAVEMRQPVRDVLSSRQVREQREMLKHVADLAALRRDVDAAGRQSNSVAIADRDLPRVRRERARRGSAAASIFPNPTRRRRS